MAFGEAMPVTVPDKRAARILAGMYWDADGWKRPHQEPTPEDRAYAEDAAYLVAPLHTDHDDLLRRTVELARTADWGQASDAFLGSLSTRHLHLRSFLPSVVVARHLPLHDFTPHGARCSVCGVDGTEQDIDLNVLNFERHKWGGVRHLDLRFVWFSLDRLAVEPIPVATPEDRELLARTLDALNSLPSRTTLAQAEPALRHLRSNKQERHILLETLALMDVLASPDHPGFLDQFIDERARGLPSKRFMDRGYPGEWWTASDGVNDAAVAALFPQLA